MSPTDDADQSAKPEHPEHPVRAEPGHHPGRAGKEHGHGYEHQDPADWIPGVELDAKMSLPPVLDAMSASLDLGTPARLLDVGCGPGVGTVELARRFPAATLTGLDVGEAVLAAATDRASAERLGDRVSFVRGDFDQELGRLVPPMDLAFASMSLHHTTDPAAALGRVRDTLRPGGRVVLAEFGRPLTMFPADHEVTTSGLWARWQAAGDAYRLDHLGAAAVDVDWPASLAGNGLERIESFEVDIRAAAPLGELERAWLAKGLRRGLEAFGDRLDPQDRSAVEGLLDDERPDGVARSTVIFVDTGRMIHTGIRP